MKIQALYKWCSATVALVPGAAIIMTNLGTPPGMSKLLLGGIVEACGAFTLLLIVTNQQKIKNIAEGKISRATVITFICFLCCLLGYIYLFNSKNIYSSKYDETVFFPLWYSGDLKDLVESGKGELGAINTSGIQSIRDAIIKTERIMNISLVIFTLIYISAFELLIVSFGLLGYKNHPTSEP